IAAELAPCIGATRCAKRGHNPPRKRGGRAKDFTRSAAGLGGDPIAQSLRRSHQPKHSGCRNYRVISGGLRPAGASTTTLSKSMSIFPSTIGLRDSISEGAYHGCFSTTPFWTACATNFPISSPSKGTASYRRHTCKAEDNSTTHGSVDRILPER